MMVAMLLTSTLGGGSSGARPSVPPPVGGSTGSGPSGGYRSPSYPVPSPIFNNRVPGGSTIPDNRTYSPSKGKQFTEEQLEIFTNKRSKVTQYKDRLKRDRNSTPDPNKCGNKKKCSCFVFELPFHLGGSDTVGGRYATHVSGSKGDFLMFAPDGKFAFFDGLVKSNGQLSKQYGVSTTRHVIEAKAWNYGSYKIGLKKAKLPQLIAETAYDFSVARQCNYKYSVVTSSPTLTRYFSAASAIPIYHVPFPRTPSQVRNGTGKVDI
jgi:hypothetical protein